MFFTERRHSERSALGLTGSYETGRIAQAEVRKKCANSILVRPVFRGLRFSVLLARVVRCRGFCHRQRIAVDLISVDVLQ
jgi:hypothetical protein